MYEFSYDYVKPKYGEKAKTYSYITDDGSEDKKAKDTKKVCHKEKT